MKFKPIRPANAAPKSLGERLRRLALFLAAGIFLAYLGLVVAGYTWLRVGRENRYVGIFDVAFLRVGEVRKALAKGYLDRAKREWEAKDYQSAYISFTSALNNDPANLEGRLEAVKFFRAVGAASHALSLLEDGLARAPDDARLIKQTFDQLLAAGRDRYVLELLHRRYGAAFSGEQAVSLQAYETLATLRVQGAAAAQKLLAQYRALADSPEGAPIVARVSRDTGDKLQAIHLMERHVQSQHAEYEDYAQLAAWQQAVAEPEKALETARTASGKFPERISAHVLLVEMQAAAATDGLPSAGQITDYLQGHAGQPEALASLALLAGRKGWVNLARDLYELGALGQADLGMLAMCYADALARSSRFAEFGEVLAQLEVQLSSNTPPIYIQQLRHRQIIAAGALRDANGVRENAQRLATSLGRDTERMEAFRRHFQQVGLTEAAAFFAPRAAGPKTPAAKSEAKN